VAELIYKREVFEVVGAAMEVYNELGPGFLEAVYQEALELELAQRNIAFESQKQLRLQYKGFRLKKEYQADVLTHGIVVVELKAISTVTNHDFAQLLNYLKATRCPVGLLINFGHAEKLQWKRAVWTQ
jgi:GxxExxY protein